MDAENPQQFKVIGRIRQGKPTVFSPYTLLALISGHLQTYDDIATVTLSLPNYIVKFNKKTSQSQLVSDRALHGPDFILDVTIGTPELESCEIPWMINRCDSDDITVSNPPKKYLDDLAGQPYGMQRYIPQLLIKGGLGIARTDAAKEPEKIFMDISNITRHYSIGASEHQATPDFSTIMISELHHFYYDKFNAFRKCQQTGKEMYEIAQLLEDKLQPTLNSIYKKTKPFRKNVPDNVLCHIMDLENSVVCVQQFIGEELFSLYNTTRPIYKRINIMPMNLNKFMMPNYEPHTPTTSLHILREILSQVIETIYKEAPNIQTQAAANNGIYVRISGRQFEHTYISNTAATTAEAEANAIYRFLKYITNIKGYTIVDENYPALFRLLTMLETWTEELEDVELCAINIIRIIDEVYDSIENIYNNLIGKWCHENKKELIKSIRKCLSLATKYHKSLHSAFKAFRTYKQEFTSTTFHSKYYPGPDEN